MPKLTQRHRQGPDFMLVPWPEEPADVFLAAIRDIVGGAELLEKFAYFKYDTGKVFKVLDLDEPSFGTDERRVRFSTFAEGPDKTLWHLRRKLSGTGYDGFAISSSSGSKTAQFSFATRNPAGGSDSHPGGIEPLFGIAATGDLYAASHESVAVPPPSLGVVAGGPNRYFIDRFNSSGVYQTSYEVPSLDDFTQYHICGVDLIDVEHLYSRNIQVVVGRTNIYVVVAESYVAIASGGVIGCTGSTVAGVFVAVRRLRLSDHTWQPVVRVPSATFNHTNPPSSFWATSFAIPERVDDYHVCGPDLQDTAKDAVLIVPKTNFPVRLPLFSIDEAAAVTEGTGFTAETLLDGLNSIKTKTWTAAILGADHVLQSYDWPSTSWAQGSTIDKGDIRITSGLSIPFPFAYFPQSAWQVL